MALSIIFLEDKHKIGVEVGKFYVRFLNIFYSETTGKFTLAMYFYPGQE
jgi:hypothetical protein